MTTGTAKDNVVVDYGKKMKVALENSNTIIQHSSQTLLLGNSRQLDSLHFSLVSWKRVEIQVILM